MRACLDFGRPRELQLTAADEMLAVENMDVLRSNGFELEQIEEQHAGDEDETESRMRLRLVAQPVSKDTTFDMKGEHTCCLLWTRGC